MRCEVLQELILSPFKSPGAASGDLGQVLLPARVPAGCLGSCWQDVRGRISKTGDSQRRGGFFSEFRHRAGGMWGKAPQGPFRGCGAVLGALEEDFIGSCAKKYMGFFKKYFYF